MKTLLAVKNSMYRIEAAVHESHYYDSEANPSGLICRRCKSFAHDGICKHVLAVTHLIEADKPEDERNNNVNLNRIMAQLNREKEPKEGGRIRRGQKRYATGGYRMLTKPLLKQLGVGKSIGQRGRGIGKSTAHRGRGRGGGRGGIVHRQLLVVQDLSTQPLGWDCVLSGTAPNDNPLNDTVVRDEVGDEHERWAKQANAERDDEESVARMAARARAGHEMVEARAAEARQVRAATVARELRLTSRGARAKQTKTQAVVIHGGTAVAAAGVSRARKHSLRTTELAPTHLSRNELYQTPPPR